MSDSNQNLETTCNSKLKFAELKYFFIKRVLNYVLYVTNSTAILEHRIFSERQKRLQIGSFNWGLENYVDLVLYIIGSDQKDIKLYLLRSSSLAKGQQTLKIKPVNIQSRSTRALIKRTSAEMELSICPKLYIYLYSYKQKQLFYSYKA